MLLKLYTLLLFSFFSIQAMNKDIPPLKDLCAIVLANNVNEWIPDTIDSCEKLQEAHKTIKSSELQWLSNVKDHYPSIYELIAKAYQQLHGSKLLLWHKTLKGHKKYVNVVIYNLDGKQIASCCDDNTIKIWSTKSYKCIKTLEGHDRWIISIAYNSDGKQLASGSYDETIKIWNLEIGTNKFGTCIKTLIGHSDAICSIAYSPDGLFLASGSLDTTIKIWNLQTGQCIRTLTDHKNQINSIVYSPDGTLLISDSSDNTIKIWDIITGECIKTLTGHTNWVKFIAYNLNGSQLASCSYDKTIKIWDLETYRCIKTLVGHTKNINSIAYNPNGMQLASCSDDKTIKIWQSYYQNPQSIEDVLFSILSSFYITNNSSQIIDLYTSTEYEKLSTNHKNAFTDYINRYTIEYPNSSVKQLIELIEQKNYQKRTASCELENNSKYFKLS